MAVKTHAAGSPHFGKKKRYSPIRGNHSHEKKEDICWKERKGKPRDRLAARSRGLSGRSGFHRSILHSRRKGGKKKACRFRRKGRGSFDLQYMAPLKPGKGKARSRAERKGMEHRCVTARYDRSRTESREKGETDIVVLYSVRKGRPARG